MQPRAGPAGVAARGRPEPGALAFDDSDLVGWEDFEFPGLSLTAVDSPEVRLFFERDLAERLEGTFQNAQASPRYALDGEVFGPAGYGRFLDRCAALGGAVQRVAEAEKRKFAPALRREERRRQVHRAFDARDGEHEPL